MHHQVIDLPNPSGLDNHRLRSYIRWMPVSWACWVLIAQQIAISVVRTVQALVHIGLTLTAADVVRMLLSAFFWGVGALLVNAVVYRLLAHRSQRAFPLWMAWLQACALLVILYFPQGFWITVMDWIDPVAMNVGGRLPYGLDYLTWRQIVEVCTIACLSIYACWLLFVVRSLLPNH